MSLTTNDETTTASRHGPLALLKCYMVNLALFDVIAQVPKTGHKPHCLVFQA